MTRASRRAAWLLAFFAVVLQATWPLLAQATPRSFLLVPVCSAGGETHYAEVPGAPSPVEKRSAQHGQHCGLCVVGAAMAPAAPDLPVLAGVSFSAPSTNTTFFAAVPAVLPGRPRAPPALS